MFILRETRTVHTSACYRSVKECHNERHVSNERVELRQSGGCVIVVESGVETGNAMQFFVDVRIFIWSDACSPFVV